MSPTVQKFGKLIRLFTISVFLASSMLFTNLNAGNNVTAADMIYVGLPCNMNTNTTIGDINDNREHHDLFGEGGQAIDLSAECDGNEVIASISGSIETSQLTVNNCNGVQKVNSVITITNTNGVKVLYYHHNEDYTSTVADGYVEAGEKLATIGNVGCSFGAHIHFEVYSNGVRQYYNSWQFAENLQGSHDYNPHVWAADVNGDGADDLLGIGEGGLINYSLSVKNGSYEEMKTSTSGIFKPEDGWFKTDYAPRVWPADINGDYKTDIVGIASNGVLVYSIGNGDGTFSPLNDYAQAIFTDNANFLEWFKTSIHPRVWIANVDNDNDDDILVIENNGNVKVSLSNGDGTFTSLTDTGGDAFSPNSGWFEKDLQPRVWPAKVNQDNYTDLLGIGLEGRVYYALSNGNGTFQNEVETSNYVFTVTPDEWFKTSINKRVWPMDVDNDKDDDLVAVNNNGDIAIHRSNGNGTFNAIQGTGGHAFDPGVDWFDTDTQNRVFPADIDGDKNLDILGVGGNGDIYFARSNGNGNFGDETRYENKAFDPTSVWFKTTVQKRIWPMDSNGDGATEIFGINNSGTFITSMNNGSASFEKETNLGGTGFGPYTTWFTTTINPRVWKADIDGQNGDDVVGIGDDGKLYYSLSNGDGTFQNVTTKNTIMYSPVTTYFKNDIHPRIWVADIDGNEKDDFVGINNSGTIITYRSNGDGTFTYKFGGQAFNPQSGWFNKDREKRVWPAKVNNDAYTDLLGIGLDGRVYYALSNGNGTFQNEVETNTYVFTNTPSVWFKTSIHSRVWPIDVDDDKDDDLIGIDSNGNIILHISNGNGTFNVEQSTGGKAFSPSSGWFEKNLQPRVWPADVDGDGDLDIVGVGTDAKLYYALSNGDGTFGDERHLENNAFNPTNSWFD